MDLFVEVIFISNTSAGMKEGDKTFSNKQKSHQLTSEIYSYCHFRSFSYINLFLLRLHVEEFWWWGLQDLVCLSCGSRGESTKMDNQQSYQFYYPSGTGIFLDQNHFGTLLQIRMKRHSYIAAGEEDIRGRAWLHKVESQKLAKPKTLASSITDKWWKSQS